MMAGNSSAEVVPTGTRDWGSCSEYAINQLSALGWDHWGLLGFLLCNVSTFLHGLYMS